MVDRTDPQPLRRVAHPGATSCIRRVHSRMAGCAGYVQLRVDACVQRAGQRRQGRPQIEAETSPDIDGQISDGVLVPRRRRIRMQT